MSTTPTIHRVAETFVAEVRGIDLATQRDADTMAWIERTLADHGVLIFHDQNLTAEMIADIGKKMGEIEAHIFGQYRHEDIAEVSYVTNRTRENEIDMYGVSRASMWHVDEPYKPYLAKLTLLHALEVPKVKGGTWFADAQGAYDALDPVMKERVDGLISSFSVKTGHSSQHPTAYVHPVTKRRGIFVSPQHQIGFVGMENDEGIALMNQLVDHATQPRFAYYHQWKVGDVVMWDDISTLHRNAVDSDPNERRIFLRTIVH
jgi:taurine dioxygenase